MLQRIRETFRSESGYRQFFIAILTVSLAYGLYKGVIDNYLAEVVTMNEFDRGVAEFFRELPGLMLVFILAVFSTLSVESMFKLGGFIMAAGVALLAGLPADRILVTAAIFVYSTGEHIQLGMRNTLTLGYAQPGRGGEALGLQSAVYQAGTLAGYLLVMAAFTRLTGSLASYRSFFWIAAAMLLVSAFVSLRLTGRSETDRTKSRFYFRKKYTKYYFLEVFYGARKQVFFTFGPYVLILFYGADAAAISLLFAVSAVCSFLLSPLVGKLIDRVGYKIIMVSDTLVLVIVCFFYGFAHHLFPMKLAYIVCCVNYILDSVISLASMAANVYVQDISDSPEEVRATISTGISVNHMITILIALFGGWIWQTLGIETLFILSAVLGLCNSAYAATIRVPAKTGQKPA